MPLLAGRRTCFQAQFPSRNSVAELVEATAPTKRFPSTPAAPDKGLTILDERQSSVSYVPDVIVYGEFSAHTE